MKKAWTEEANIEGRELLFLCGVAHVSKACVEGFKHSRTEPSEGLKSIAL